MLSQNFEDRSSQPDFKLNFDLRNNELNCSGQTEKGLSWQEQSKESIFAKLTRRINRKVSKRLLPLSQSNYSQTPNKFGQFPSLIQFEDQQDHQQMSDQIGKLTQLLGLDEAFHQVENVKEEIVSYFLNWNEGGKINEPLLNVQLIKICQNFKQKMRVIFHQEKEYEQEESSLCSHQLKAYLFEISKLRKQNGELRRQYETLLKSVTRNHRRQPFKSKQTQLSSLNITHQTLLRLGQSQSCHDANDLDISLGEQLQRIKSKPYSKESYSSSLNSSLESSILFQQKQKEDTKNYPFSHQLQDCSFTISHGENSNSKSIVQVNEYRIKMFESEPVATSFKREQLLFEMIELSVNVIKSLFENIIHISQKVVSNNLFLRDILNEYHGFKANCSVQFIEYIQECKRFIVFHKDLSQKIMVELQSLCTKHKKKVEKENSRYNN